MRPVKFNLILAFVLIGLSSIVAAQTSTALSFRISGGEGGTFPVLTNQSGNAMDYVLSSGQVDFVVDTGLSYENPVFCFDFSDEATAVTLQAQDPNGNVVLNSIGMDSALAYDLPSGAITFSPGASVQCFFEGADPGKIGLFGQKAHNQRDDGTTDPGALFTDEFAAFPELDIQYLDLQINDGQFQTMDGATVSPGDEIAYDLVISNSGNASADQLAFQEVFPADATMFTSSLSTVSWTCVDNSVELEAATAFCPAGTGTGPLRFDATDGLQLPPGGSMTFTIIRNVQAGSEGQIRLFAGAVNGPGKIARNAAADPVLDIVGESTQLEFVQQPTNTTVGQVIDPPVSVEVVDSNGNRVTTDDSTSVALELYHNGTRIDGALASGVVASGVVSFGSLDTTGLAVGTDYQIKAVHGVLEPTISPRISAKFALQ